MSLQLRIVTPERIVFEGQIESVSAPGTQGRFEILNNHAPIISALKAGNIIYNTADARQELSIVGGFIHVVNNIVSLCVELR